MRSTWSAGQKYGRIVAQPREPPGLLFALALRDLVGAREPDDERDRQRPRTQTALVPAAELPRHELHPRLPSASHVEQPHALRPVELVAGHAHQIEGLDTDVERDLARRLRGVGMEDDPARMAAPGDLGERGDYADLVVGGHDRDEARVVPQGVVEIGERKAPFLVHGKLGYRPTASGERTTRIEHRGMLGRDGDEMARLADRIREAEDRQVVALGRTAREDDLARLGGPEQLREPLRRLGVCRELDLAGRAGHRIEYCAFL